jgi:transgelin
MANYGLSAQVAAKMASKRDSGLDGQAQEWIEAIIGEKFPSNDYATSLKDGIVLCK